MSNDISMTWAVLDPGGEGGGGDGGGAGGGEGGGAGGGLGEVRTDALQMLRRQLHKRHGRARTKRDASVSERECTNTK